MVTLRGVSPCFDSTNASGETPALFPSTSISAPGGTVTTEHIDAWPFCINWACIGLSPWLKFASLKAASREASAGPEFAATCAGMKFAAAGAGVGGEDGDTATVSNRSASATCAEAQAQIPGARLSPAMFVNSIPRLVVRSGGLELEGVLTDRERVGSGCGRG